MKENKKDNDKFHFVKEEPEQYMIKEDSNESHISIETLMNADDETNTKLFNTEELSVIQENIKEEKQERKTNNKLYFGYKFRVGFLIVLVLLFFTSGVCCILHSLKSTKSTNVGYIENADAVYKVCVQTSDPYLTNCVDYSEYINMAEVSNLKVDFNYIAELKEAANVDLVYHIMAINRIYDKFDSSKILYENEDMIVNEQPIQFIKNKTDTNKEFTVDVKKYNDFVIDYQEKYPFSSEASLEVIVYVSDGKDEYEVGKMNIPLGVEKLVVYKNFLKQTENTTEVLEREWTNKNTLYIVLGSILILSSLTVMIFLTRFVQKTLTKKSKYEQRLNEILTEYNRMIVEARDGYESNIIKQVVKVPSFEELLDAKESLNKPIIYSKVNNIKSEFIVEDEKKIYKYVLKEADLEKESEEK